MFIIVTSILACIILYIVERVFLVSYEVKTITKIVVFTTVPFLYWVLFKPKRDFKGEKKNFLLSTVFSVAVFSIILLGYFIFRSVVDFESIHNELALTPKAYLLRGVYIIFGNSFLEEFFFRGFIFLNLYRNGLKKTSYIFSSTLFTVYHMAMLQTWFNLTILLLVLLSLFVVGFVFNYLCTRVQSFRGSWVVHASADSAIILVGVLAFYS